MTNPETPQYGGGMYRFQWSDAELQNIHDPRYPAGRSGGMYRPLTAGGAQGGIDWSTAGLFVKTQLEEWGLGSLADKAFGFIQSGDTGEVALFKLRDTQEYKQRFIANETRRKKGLPALSEAEYLQNETQYKNAMRQYGLPEGFYDSQDDFRKFLENDVSPQELKDRAAIASERYLNAAPDVKDQFAREGLDPGGAIAMILDPNRALPLIRQKVTAYGLAAEAARSFNDREHLNLNRALELAQLGIDDEAGRKGFGELAGRQERDQYLAKLAGDSVSDRESEDEVFFGNRDVTQRLEKARNEEKARFRQGYLATETGLTRGTSGSY